MQQCPRLLMLHRNSPVGRSQAFGAGGIDVSLLRSAVELIAGAVPTEASGNVTLKTVRQIAATGVTYISCGALTHSVHAMDISLKIRTLDKD